MTLKWLELRASTQPATQKAEFEICFKKCEKTILLNFINLSTIFLSKIAQAMKSRTLILHIRLVFSLFFYFRVNIGTSYQLADYSSLIDS